MSVKTPAATLHEELLQAVEHEIVRRTWGRVHRLAVEATGARLIVHGSVPSYYVKQLAIQAVVEVLAAAGPVRVELDLEVAAGDFRVLQGPHGRWAGA